MAYFHQSKHEVEWKSNIELWPLDIKMEIETITNKGKEQKRHVGQIENTEMVGASLSKKSKT